MTALAPELLNRFARGLSAEFGRVAKGLDDESSRFVAVRAHDRILTGFLTPADNAMAGTATPMGFDIPELPVDEAFDQSAIGFEWSAPASALATTVLQVDVGFNVFVRTLPDFVQANANKVFDRGGRSPLVEIWERVELATVSTNPIQASIRLADISAVDRSLRVSLASAVISRTVPVPSHGLGLYRGATELYLTAAEFVDEPSYSAFVRNAMSTRQPLSAGWEPAIDVRVLPAPTEPGRVYVLLRLINATSRGTRSSGAFTDPRLYAASLRIVVPEGAQRDTEFRVLPSSYRYDRRVASVGINCQPIVTRDGGNLVMRSETVPVQESPRIVPRSIEGAEPKFDPLSDAALCVPLLRAIAAGMREYDGTAWERKVAELTDPGERTEAVEDRELFRGEIGRFEAGIDLLESVPNGATSRAFRLMNTTMKRLGASRRRTYDQWHLFQIVYIVSMLPKLIEEGGQQPRELSLLWFPAGGGKTEAFLGLILWHAFFDRLSGKRFGTTALLRYPLRLLTYQQLQRLSRALGAANAVRRENSIEGEEFSLGYLVGESTTPNQISNDLHARLDSGGIPQDWQRIFECPTCGGRTISLRYNPPMRLIEHFCNNRACSSRGARLPVYIVDHDVYRFVPTVIVSTVDKLAGLGQNRRFAQILGRIAFRCSEHGAAFGGSNDTLCAASREAKMGRAPVCGTHTIENGPFPRLAPGLHIQDELHLLRESLATFDSHYETGAMAVQRSIDPDAGEWSLIGATATIEGHREQASHLYLAVSQRFPAPGPEAFDSFYYHRDGSMIGRIYLGVLGVGRTHTPSVARAIYILHTLIEGLRRDRVTALDAVTRRFGIAGASDSEVAALAFLYEVVLTYVLTRKGGDQVGEAIDSRVRAEVERIADAPLRIKSFHGSVDMPEMISAMEEIESATDSSPLGERIRSVVATNIISHGVDIDRFNVMVFAGMPKHASEYIQASARVGRQWPAIALLVATPQAERDRSVLHRFAKFHQYVDRLVEPVPINRWLEQALQLTIPGLIVAYLQGVVPSKIGKELYMVGHIQDRFGMPGMNMLDESAVVEWVQGALSANDSSAPEGFAEAVRTLTTRLYGKVTGATDDMRNEPLNIFLLAMQSLRDVDEPAWINATMQASESLKRLGV